MATAYRPPPLYREELTPRLGSAVNTLDGSVVDNNLPMILLERPRAGRIFPPELRDHRVRSALVTISSMKGVTKYVEALG